MRNRFRAVRTALALAAVALAILGDVVPARAIGALQLNNLSSLGTQGLIRARSIFQDGTGASVLQTGVPTDSRTNPNRTIGDAVAVAPFNTPGPRFLGNNPFAGDGHTHYHGSDTRLLLNDVTGFALGDTILVGSPNCNFAFRSLNCKTSFPAANEQPYGQVVHVVGGDIGQVGPGILDVTPLTNNPQCTLDYGFGACAIVEGVQVAKTPTVYQGQQLRIDIAHADLLNGGLNPVAVTADFIPPQGSNDPSYPRRPLTLNRETTATSAIVSNTCPCGSGFFSFYVPKEIFVTQTIGNTFSVDLGHTWYQIIVTARDTVTGAVQSDGVLRLKPNPVAITEFSPDRDPIEVTTAVNLRGRLRDNSSAAGLTRLPVEDVIVDVVITKPSGVQSTYQTTSCVDTDPGPADRCGSDPFGSQPHGHGAFQIRVGGLQGLFVGIPGIGQSTLNCSGQVILSNPSTYPRILNVPGCALAPILSTLDTLEPGTYDALATLRGFNPPVARSTTFDVVLF